MNLKCSKCGSEKIIPFATMLDRGQGSPGTLEALVGYSNPEAWIFKGSITATLKAQICGECGYTELIADNPAYLYSEYLRGKSQERD
jgi:ribosomal protein S27AE